MADAMSNVTDMFKRASELGQSALAITDHGTIAAAYDARKASVKYGVKYIPGIEAYFVDDIEDKKQRRRHIVLLAQSEIGYKNLLRMNYEGYINSQYVGVMNKVFPRIDWKILQKYNEGIICLTACGSGLISRQMFVHDDDGHWLQDSCHKNVNDVIARLKGIFGENLYLEIQPHNLYVVKKDRKTGEKILGKDGNEIVIIDQNYINRRLIKAAKDYGIKLVATSDVHYINKEDAKIHDMLMAISSKAALSDKTRHRYEVNEFYMKSGRDIINFFADNFDEKLANEVVANSSEIANKCGDTKYLDRSEVRFPKFDIKLQPDCDEFAEWFKKQKFYNKGVKEDHAFLRFRCIKGFREKYAHLSKESKKVYIDRMMEEISVLEMHNFSSYMLIVSDFVAWAKDNNVRVGPGRGSVGGCLVANLLDIHVADPIKYGLLFSRFHNKEKTSFPDIDIDFSPDGRDLVEQYIVRTYGKEKVAHVSNLITMTPKVVIKDVARSLELGGSKSEAFKIANKITDTIPADANTFDDALRDSPDFRDFIDAYPQLEVYGRKLVGLEKTYATHAAGVVIGDIDLSTYVPLRADKNGTISVQYEKNRCEAEGLIKMDLLGLEHLRIIDNTIRNSKKMGIDCPEPEDIDLNDSAVWDNISKGRTIRVFQMESAHFRSICKRIKPRSIEDLSLANALGRPSAGKKGEDGSPAPRDIYIARRDGKEKVSFRHECLRESLGETLGICVYEEQLAKLAGTVAGWDLNKADGLRKLTKLKEKGKDLADRLRADFVKDSMKFSSLRRSEAEDIWKNVIEPFAGYGFNKAHGIFYSLNGYHTAYYKHYYPAAFMAACLRAEVGKGSTPGRDANIKLYKQEAVRLGLTMKYPDINYSSDSFEAIDTSTIVTGLDAIKGVGKSAVEEIMSTRDVHRFKTYHDFLYRTSSRLVRKNVIQALVKAGVLDSLGVTRHGAFEFYADIRTKANKLANDRVREGMDAWTALDDFTFTKDGFTDEWDKKTKLLGEQETLGEYISGDINDLYEGFFTDRGVTPLAKVKNLPNRHTIRIEAIIDAIDKSKLKNGKNKGLTYAKCSIIDRHKDNVKMTVWPDKLGKYGDEIATGKPIRAICSVNIWGGGIDLVLDRIEK